MTAATARVEESIKTAHAELMHRWRWRTAPIRRIARAFSRRHGLTVQSGPFEGMTFPEFAVGRAEVLVAQLLGAYERELHAALSSLPKLNPRTIVDIGASDGYYAVGLARTSTSTVYAYEMNPFPARVCARLAQANGVADRVIVRGECTVEELRGLPIESPAFVLCDCEGAERQLMDPSAVPWLHDSTLIVECHEFAAPGIETELLERFSSSHRVEIVRSERRYVSDYPQLTEVPGLSYIDREIAVSELRTSPIAWALMTPKRSHPALT